MPETRQALRLPGRVFVKLVPKALTHAGEGDPDRDIAIALSHARVKSRGAGFQTFTELDLEQVLRLADWITDDDPIELRRYRDAMREQVAAAQAADGRSPLGCGSTR